MTRIIDVRLPAAEDCVWVQDAADAVEGVVTMFEVANVRVMVRVIEAQVDPHDSGYLLIRMQMPEPREADS